MPPHLKDTAARAGKILEMIGKQELSASEREWVTGETVKCFQEYVNPGFLEYRKSWSKDYAIIEWQDSGSTFHDLEGNEYIDCLGGYGVYNCGHRHPRVVEAVVNQLKRQALPSLELMDPLRGMLAGLIADITPGDLKYSFFGNSGTEAVEGALKLAKAYTGRRVIVAATRGFHGKSMGSLSATAKAVFRKPFYPLVPGYRHVPYGDIDAMRKLFEAQAFIGDEVAGVILEPIQGEGGVILPPDDYFPAVRRLCDEFGALLIADEVQTGMGRTGKMFGIDHYGVAPDIISLAKALGGGVMPIGAFTAAANIWEPLIPNPLLHSTTFGGNPVSCAAAIAAISVTLEEGLAEQAAEKGAYFLPRLQALMARHADFCIEARGRGLLLGLEFADDRLGFEVARGLFANHVLVAGTMMNAKTIRIEPPLTISYEQIDRVLGILENVLQQVAHQQSR
jgi:putrescine aminotransferase